MVYFTSEIGREIELSVADCQSSVSDANGKTFSSCVWWKSLPYLNGWLPFLSFAYVLIYFSETFEISSSPHFSSAFSRFWAFGRKVDTESSAQNCYIRWMEYILPSACLYPKTAPYLAQQIFSLSCTSHSPLTHDFTARTHWQEPLYLILSTFAKATRKYIEFLAINWFQGIAGRWRFLTLIYFCSARLSGHNGEVWIAKLLHLLCRVSPILIRGS